MINSSMEGVEPYDTIKVLSEMTYDDVMNYMKNELSPEKLAISIVKGEA